MTSPDNHTEESNTEETNTEETNDGVVDGPGEPAKPKVDPKKIGPDGTVYDDDATDEVRRKMGIDD